MAAAGFDLLTSGCMLLALLGRAPSCDVSRTSSRAVPLAGRTCTATFWESISGACLTTAGGHRRDVCTAFVNCMKGLPQWGACVMIPV